MPWPNFQRPCEQTETHLHYWAFHGGHITGVAIEQYPKSFDGALPMCGVMGDNELFDYFLDYQVVAQWLTETNVGYPFPPDYATAIVPQMISELGTPFPTVLNDDGKKLRTATKYFRR